MVMSAITSVDFRKILNSHVDFVTEFSLKLDDGSIGCGASPVGETISIYEDRGIRVDPESVIQQMARDGCLGRPFDQEGFDDYLISRIDRFGRNTAYSLSLAFFRAREASHSTFEFFGRPEGKLEAPKLCCNILNGGWHAYTNPVLSDFSEYLLVAVGNDIEATIGAHNEIQRAVRENLASKATAVVGGNPVHQFATRDNRECIECLLAVCDKLGFSDQFELMIDASAGDLKTDRGYQLSITDNSVHSSEEFREYWMDLIRQYGLAFLEDPFDEEDVDSWRHLTGSQATCRIIGDNLYSSDAARIEQGASQGQTHGIIVKPNQSGTVSGVRRAVATARRHGQIIISSHRSISTEETFLSLLTCMSRIPYIKIGPLVTDYSSVVRLNEIIRLTS
jgi:enolase